MANLRVALIALVVSGCTPPHARILDLHASFREIWLGAEQWNTGKEAEVSEQVTLDLDSPASGNVKGVVFAPVDAATCKEPIAAVVTNPGTANSVEVAPQTPLIGDCSYEFVVPETTPLARNGGHLVAPLRVRFRVNATRLNAAQRELIIQKDQATGSPSVIQAREGINTTVREALERYQNTIGIPASDLQPAVASSPETESRRFSDTLYVQHHGAYVVSGYGYMISSQGGFFRSALGKVMPRLPSFEVPALTEDEALKRVTMTQGLAQPPWDVPGNHFQKPRALLQLVRLPANAAGAGFVPVWGFTFEGTGYPGLSYMDIDARSGQVVGKDTVHVVE